MFLCAVIYLPALAWALGLDQNIFAEIGSLLLHGKKPYVDAWDVKPPNIFYTYALFEAIFGKTDFAIRLSDYISTLVACGALYAAVWARVKNRFANPIYLYWSPVVAALLLVLTLLSLGLSDTGQTESYALCFILFAPYLAFRGKNWKSFLAGVCIGIAAFYKSTNAIFLLPLLLEVLLIRPKLTSASKRSKTFALIIAGFLFWSILQLAVLAVEGSLLEFLRITRSVIAIHPHEVSTLTTFGMIRALWVSVDVWLIIATFGLGWAIFRGDWRELRTIRLPLLYLTAGLVAVLIQNKGWGYQYVITHPGLMSSCAILSVYLFERVHEKSRVIAVGGAIIIIGLSLGVTGSARRRIRNSLDAVNSIQNHTGYLASLGKSHSLYYPLCTEKLAKYLSLYSTDTDQVFIFGEEPAAYWKADRNPSNRYIYSLLFTSGVISDPNLRSMSMQMANRPPTLIVIERYDTTSFRGYPETSASLVANDSRFERIHSLLGTRYSSPDTVCENFLVYRRLP